MGYFHEELVLDHSLLRILEHFRVAKVDYAKNVTKYTEIQRERFCPAYKSSKAMGILKSTPILPSRRVLQN